MKGVPRTWTDKERELCWNVKWFFLGFSCLTTSVFDNFHHEKIKIEQCVKYFEAYWEIGSSNKNASLSLGQYFSHRIRPIEREIGYINHEFKQNGSVADVKTAMRASIGHLDDNVGVVHESVTENLCCSIFHRAQELTISTTTLHRIVTIDLHLQTLKPQLTEELNVDDGLKLCNSDHWVQKQSQTEDDIFAEIPFSGKAYFHLCLLSSTQNCRIWTARSLWKSYDDWRNSTAFIGRVCLVYIIC